MRWRRTSAAAVAAAIARALYPPAEEGTGAGRGLPLTGFQEAAVRRAGAVLSRRGGVVIADEVGLGKTYVALALVEEALGRGDAVVVVVPAAVRGTWERLIRQGAALRAAGDALHLTTHARLSRGTHDVRRLAAAGLVVVDEAHAFRNPRTRRYRALAGRRADAGLVLITATPVNNAVADLYHLVRQFARDDAFRDLGIASLRAAFLGPGGSGSPGEDALRVAREVVVRRSRADVSGANVIDAEVTGADREPGRSLRFPRRAPTRVIRYDDPRVPGLVEAVGALELAPYAGQAEALVRLGLLKRLESGAPALAGSLRGLRALLVAFAGAAAHGRLLRPADRLAYGSGSDGAMQLGFDEILATPAPPATDLAALAASARRDAAAVGAMLRALDGPDPKLEALRGWLGGVARGERVVVFTEFRDTAASLWRALLPRGGVGRVDGGGAWLGPRRSGRRAVVERFAPAANGAREPPMRERVELLVATDVLSEGLNLQDARVVVSYDLPWNPVRLLQRIGRVDRLGSPHDDVLPVLFVPGAGLDDVLRLTRRLRDKLGGIAATIGAGEAGELLARLGGASAAGNDPLRDLEAARRDPWEALRVRVAACGEGLPPGRGSGTRPLLGSARVGAGRGGWLVLVRRAGSPAELLVVRGTRAVRASARHAGVGEADALASLLDRREDRGTRPRDSTASASAARAAAVAVRALRARAPVSGAPAVVVPADPAVQLAAQVRRLVAGLGPAPDPSLLLRADEALRVLAVPPPLAGRLALDRLARRARGDGQKESDGVRSLEALLQGIRNVHGGTAPPVENGRWDRRPPGVPASLGRRRIEVLAVLRLEAGRDAKGRGKRAIPAVDGAGVHG